MSAGVIAVPGGEVRVIGGDRDLAEPGEERGAPSPAGPPRRASALHEAEDELAVPALAGQGVPDPGAPAVGSQARVASYRPPRAACRSR